MTHCEEKALPKYLFCRKCCTREWWDGYISGGNCVLIRRTQQCHTQTLEKLISHEHGEHHADGIMAVSNF